MDISWIKPFLTHLSFREGVWLFPVAFVLHVREELPHFTAWARQNASQRFTQREYNVIHAAGVIVSLLSAAILWYFPNKWVVFAFFAFVFAPSAFFNTFFHAGATVISGRYCPGLLTGLTLYLPLFYFLNRLALHEGLLEFRSVLLALIIAGIFHAAEVGHNVYKAW